MDEKLHTIILYVKRPKFSDDPNALEFFYNYIERTYLEDSIILADDQFVATYYETAEKVIINNVHNWMNTIGDENSGLAPYKKDEEGLDAEAFFIKVDYTGRIVREAVALELVYPKSIKDVTPPPISEDEKFTNVKMEITFAMKKKDGDHLNQAQKLIDDLMKEIDKNSSMDISSFENVYTFSPLLRDNSKL